jgi:hypothetical protein
MFLGNRLERRVTVKFVESEMGLSGCAWVAIKTAAVERGNENWRNNGLEEATGSNNSEAIWPSSVVLLMNGSGG